MAIAIEVENLSKQYRLGKIGTGSLAHDVNRWWHTVRGKEDPYLKIGEVNDRTQAGTSEYVWSLRDINFKIEQGDAVGIIGRNGAGKSTLLKILSRVTAPTTGSINIKGRVASLLEVGTGFHPELTGRENVFLNGAILGMRKKEITRKFDEIVDFAGVERYVDTPVKRYSSGMYVRLAFAVAAHLESEILIVDEVLAVGDAEFQKKCLGKMQQLNKQEYRTILFVTHNMSLVTSLCNTGILLRNGVVDVQDTIEKVLTAYNRSNGIDSLFNSDLQWKSGAFSKKIDLRSITITDINLVQKTTFLSSDLIYINFNVLVRQVLKSSRIVLFVYSVDNANSLAFQSSTNDSVLIDDPGNYEIRCEIPSTLLNEGLYDIFIQIGEPGIGVLLDKMFVTRIECLLDRKNGFEYVEKWQGVVRPRLCWSLNKENEAFTNF